MGAALAQLKVVVPRALGTGIAACLLVSYVTRSFSSRAQPRSLCSDELCDAVLACNTSTTVSEVADDAVQAKERRRPQGQAFAIATGATQSYEAGDIFGAAADACPDDSFEALPPGLVTHTHRRKNRAGAEVANAEGHREATASAAAASREDAAAQALAAGKDFTGGRRRVRQAIGLMTTTIMMDTPKDMLRPELERKLDRHGYSGLYDFVYLPTNWVTRQNYGFGIVNFVSPAALQSRLCRLGVDVAAFVVQGQQELIAKYRDNGVMQAPAEQFKPALFRDGKWIPFPKSLRRAQNSSKSGGGGGSAKQVAVRLSDSFPGVHASHPSKECHQGHHGNQAAAQPTVAAPVVWPPWPPLPLPVPWPLMVPWAMLPPPPVLVPPMLGAPLVGQHHQQQQPARCFLPPSPHANKDYTAQRSRAAQDAKPTKAAGGRRVSRGAPPGLGMRAT